LVTLRLLKRRDKFFLAVRTIRELFLCWFAGREFDEMHRAAALGDAVAQAWVAGRTVSGEDSFRWAVKSAAQGEREGFWRLGHCYRYERGCEEDVERAKGNFLLTLDKCKSHLCWLFDKDDPQRFVWFGRAAASNGDVHSFLDEMSNQIRIFNSGTDMQRFCLSSGEL
jgi:hypothetical protein